MTTIDNDIDELGGTLFVGADAGGAAQIDLAALLAPNTADTAREVRVTVTRSDGVVVADGSLGDLASSPVTLQATPTDARFTIRASWFDYDDYIHIFCGDKSLEMSVYVFGLDELVVEDANDGDNYVDVSDAEPADLCISEDDGGYLNVCLAAFFYYDGYGNTTCKYNKWEIDQGTTVVANGGFTNCGGSVLFDTTPNVIRFRTPDMTDDFTFIAFVDQNQDGHPGQTEQQKTVKIHDTTMPFIYPFNENRNGTKPSISSSIAITNGKLRVTIADAPGYKKTSQGYDLYNVMTGTNSPTHDTDSAQFVVVWKDAGGNVVGKYTNAKPQNKARTSGALWVKENYTTNTPVGIGKRRVHQDSLPVPTNAASFTVILIYTDTLDKPYKDAEDEGTKGSMYGDLPMIIGSWSSTLGTDGKLRNVQRLWSDTFVAGHITGTYDSQSGYFTVAQQSEYTAYVKNLIKTRTGYHVVKRENDDVYFDTGYDIKP
jgi:hypothetical protein